MTTIISNPDQATLFRDFAKIFFASARSIDKPEIVCALPGGRSIVGFLHALRDTAPVLGGEILRRFHFFMVDERCVPLESPESNFRLLKEQAFNSLLGAGLISESQLHPFIYDPTVADRGTERYEAELKKFGGVFDISILGVGEDAHVGALFPHHASIGHTGSLFFSFDGSPKPPPLRMTASADLLGHSPICAGLFLGEAKREALVKFRDPKLSVGDCPAKLLSQSDNSYVLTDLV